jgi:hypothetical protein
MKNINNNNKKVNTNKQKGKKNEKNPSIVQETPNVTNIFMLLLLIAGASRLFF